jgi:hypothetical protein
MILCSVLSHMNSVDYLIERTCKRTLYEGKEKAVTKIFDYLCTALILVIKVAHSSLSLTIVSLRLTKCWGKLLIPQTPRIAFYL